MYKKLFFICVAALSVTLFSCNDDESMTEDLSVDITGQIVGSYRGVSTFGEGGSSLTEENRTATVTLQSDSVVNFMVSSFFGDAVRFDAKLSTETEFSTDDASVLGETGYTGSGRISGDSLFINLISGSEFYGYVGERQ